MKKLLFLSLLVLLGCQTVGEWRLEQEYTYSLVCPVCGWWGESYDFRIQYDGADRKAVIEDFQCLSWTCGYAWSSTNWWVRLK